MALTIATTLFIWKCIFQVFSVSNSSNKWSGCCSFFLFNLKNAPKKLICSFFASQFISIREVMEIIWQVV